MNFDSPGVHPAVIAVVRELHGKAGVWSEEEQAAFLGAFAAVLKMAYPAHDAPDAADGGNK